MYRNLLLTSKEVREIHFEKFTSSQAFINQNYLLFLIRDETKDNCEVHVHT